MSNLKRAIGCIDKLIELHSSPSLIRESTKLSEEIGGELPEGLLTTYLFLSASEEFDLYGFFWGHSPISLDSLIEGMHPNYALLDLIPKSNPFDRKLYGAPFLAVDKFRGLDDPRELDDEKSMFALGELHGSYLYQNIEADEAVNGIIGEDDTIGVYFAPSLIEHLLDLKAGLASKKYIAEEEEVIHPRCWFGRIKLLAGEVTMDEYGDINEN